MASDYDDDRDELEGRDQPVEDRDERIIRRAQNRIKTPAIVLLVSGIVGLLVTLASVPSLFTMDKQFAQVQDQWDKDPNLKPEQKKEMKQMLNTYKDVAQVVLPISIVLSLITAGITILGSIMIMKLKGKGIGIMGSVLSMIPIASGCCCMGLPVGIWVLVVLSKPEVKAGFAAVAARSRQSPDGY